MSPRKKKTQKLRQELSEYTSLIRALHTASTQDLLPHLLGTFPRPPSVPSSRSASTHPSRSSGVSSTSDSRSRLGEEVRSASGDLRDDTQRDIWTRWPLLKGDVYVPEWSLQDEVRSIAERSAREWLDVHTRQDANVQISETGLHSPLDGMEVDGTDALLDEPEDENDAAMDEKAPRLERTNDDVSERVQPLPEEDMLTKGVLNGLTLESSNLLSQTFACLAAHRPSVDPGLQNRLRTVDWKSALSVIGSAGIFDQSILQDVQTRMERIHSEGDRRVLGRLQTHSAAKRRVHDIEDSLGSRVDLLHFPRPRKKRRKQLPSDEEMETLPMKAIASDEAMEPMSPA